VATMSQNDDDSISFVNFQADHDPKNLPTLTVQAGEWDSGDGFAAGFTFLVTGPVTPLLTPADARKLARWLQRLADALEGTKKASDNKKKRKRHYDDDDDDENFSNYNFR